MTKAGMKTPAVVGRLWFVLDTLWRPFEFRLSNTKDCKDLSRRFAVTDIDSGIIYFQETLPYQALVFLAVHEIFHAMVSSPSESDALAKLLGCSAAKVDAKEELLVVHMTPRLVDAFVRSGFLSFPPLPEKEGGAS